MRSLTVVALATLCLMGASALALADEALKSEMGQKGRMKAERDAMKSEMRTDKKQMKGSIMESREKMKAKRHEMMEKMKAHREAAKANLTAPAPTTAP